MKNKLSGFLTAAFIFLMVGSVSAAIVAPGKGWFGTQTNDNATTGYVGEILTSQILSASAVSLSATSAVTDASASAVNVTSVTLTPGDWDVTGVVDIATSGTTATDVYAGTSATSGVLAADSTFALPVTYTTVTNTASLPTPVVRYSVAAATPVYLTSRALYSAGTTTAYGTIRARRVR